MIPFSLLVDEILGQQAGSGSDEKVLVMPAFI